MDARGGHGPAWRVTIEATAGWLTCPLCRQNHRLLRVRPDTRAENLQLYCRTCKRELVVDIKGERLKAHGR